MMRPLLVITFTILLSNCYSQFINEEHIYGSQTWGGSHVVTGDLNNDGFQDLIVSLVQKNKVVWYSGDGSGIYGEQKLVTPNSTYAFSSIPGDFDDDGDLDILFTSVANGTVAWAENDGNGNFINEYTIDVLGLYAAYVIQVADLNNDGRADVIAAHQTNDAILWYENMGSGQFSAAVQITNMTNDISAIECYDIDLDGDVDVLSASTADNKIAWYENNGSGIFGNQQIITTASNAPHSIDLVDINGDFNLDIVVASVGDDEVSWYPSIGAGVFGSKIIVTSSIDYPTESSVGDMDGDGDIDIVVASQNDGKFVWYANDGSGNFGLENLLRLSSYPSWVHVDDLDNDGDLDVVSTSAGNGPNEAVTYLNFNNSGAFEQYIFGSNSSYQQLESADVDNDGDMDVFYADVNQGILGLLLNESQGNFGLPIELLDTIAAQDIHSSDVDGDSDFDLIIGYMGGVKMLLNNGFGAFQDTVLVTDTLLSIRSVSSGDFDGNGTIDILASSTLEELVWYENDGLGNIIDSYIIDDTVGSSEEAVVVDFDLDGDLDVLLASYSSNTILWYENVAMGISWIEHIVSSTALGAVDVDFGDFNGDGYIDIVGTLALSNSIELYVNDGTNLVFTPQSIVTGSTTYNQTTISDINNDGSLDILSSSAIDDKIDLFENNGAGIFSGEIQLSNSLDGIQSFIIVDLDSDGAQDIVSGSGADSEISWLESQFASPYSISGVLFYDENQNQIFDSTDFPINQYLVSTSPVNQYNSIFFNGYYNVSLSQAGIFNVSPPVIPGWSVSTDSISYMANLTAVTPTLDSASFGFFYDSVFTEMSIELTGGFPRCNNIVNYWIDYENLGSSISNGVIQLALDPILTFVSSTIPYDSVSGSNYFFSADSLYPFQSDGFLVEVLFPDFNSLGQELNSAVTIFQSSGVTFSDSLSQVVVCAYDPNDKNVSPAGVSNAGFIKPTVEYLEYTVRFQNTGNDTAQFVLIKDQLSNYLNISSFELLSTSHNAIVEINQAGLLEVKFFGIQLPDSSVNYSGSQGFVKYKIKLLPNLPIGTIIKNTANIFFDSNPKVVTNTTINTIDLCFDSPVAEISSLLEDSLCVNHPSIILPSAFPPAGSYYGAGVVNGDNFDPAVPGIGTHSVFYEFVNQDGCSSLDSIKIEVLGCAIVDEYNMSNIQIYPNPATDYITIQWPSMNDRTQILLTNIMGEVLIKVKNNSEPEVTIDVSGLSKGVFIVNVIQDDASVGKSILVVQ